MITQSQIVRDVAIICLFEVERLRQQTMVQDLLELKRIRAALLNNSSMDMGQLAWPRCSHEGYEVLPKTLATHISALYYRQCWGFFHIQNI